MEWVESLNTESAFASDAWLEIIDWQRYTTKESPTVAEHLREVSQQVRPPDADDGDYLPARETKTAHNLVLETNRVTIINYLNHFEIVISSHILHWNLVSLEHRRKKSTRETCGREQYNVTLTSQRMDPSRILTKCSQNTGKLSNTLYSFWCSVFLWLMSGIRKMRC
jgi:hypothetical protein